MPITYHLDGNMEHSFEIKLATALCEEVLETLAKKVHNHDVVHFAILGLLVTNEM